MASSKLFDDVALISDTLATDIPAPFCERFAALTHSLRRPPPFNAIGLSETLSVLFWAFELVADLKRGRRTPGKISYELNFSRRQISDQVMPWSAVTRATMPCCGIGRLAGESNRNNAGNEGQWPTSARSWDSR